MNDCLNMQIIARIHNGFSSKFAIPRQSGLTSVRSTVVFEPEFALPECIRGIECFTHLWLIWQFSEAADKPWTATVRPPKLGGNTRVGVFATRSPFRPNNIGLSSVKLERIVKCESGNVILEVSGADLMDGTPILDIKPYLPYTDCHTDASDGFALSNKNGTLSVTVPGNIACSVPNNIISQLTELLAQDPRPSYHDAPERVYSFEFDSYHVEFTVSGDQLFVNKISKI